MPDADLHLAESKLVQDKIDKIGNFRFLIRGWAVTLVSTFIGAATVADLHWASNGVLLLALFLFSAVERSQAPISSALNSRAFALERDLVNSAPPPAAGTKPRGLAPRLARTVVSATTAQKKQAGAVAKLAALTNEHFYVALALVVIVATGFRLLSAPKPQPITITTSGPALRISAEAPPPKPPVPAKGNVKR